MGHHLNTFVGRPEVLAGLAPAIRGLRLLALPQAFALAPLPGALGDAVLIDHGPFDGWRELEHDEDGVGLGPELATLAAAVSRTGPIGWLKSEWFGGVGDNRLMLWRDGATEPVTLSADMLAALGVRRVAASPPSVRAGEPALLDPWDSLGLGDIRNTERAYAAATPVATPGAAPAQRVMLDAVRTRLGPGCTSPVLDLSAEPDRCRLTDAYLFETSFVRLHLAGRTVWVFTRRQGGGLGALLPLDPSDHGAYDVPTLTLEPAGAARLGARGWRARWRVWEGAWPDAEHAADALLEAEALLRA
jgi:hypothetical protein